MPEPTEPEEVDAALQEVTVTDVYSAVQQVQLTVDRTLQLIRSVLQSIAFFVGILLFSYALALVVA